MSGFVVKVSQMSLFYVKQEIMDRVLAYIIEREKVMNAKGFFRCEEEISGEECCKQQCQKCKDYYQKKLNSK